MQAIQAQDLKSILHSKRANLYYLEHCRLLVNGGLDHGNYLADGLGATAAWVLGLPHALAVLHGKTRRGGLVFDIADLIKDAVILPQAFLSASQGHTEQEFRQTCIEALTRTEALDFMFDVLKRTAASVSQMAMADKGNEA